MLGGQGGTRQTGTKTKKDNQKCGSLTSMVTYPQGQYINRIFAYFYNFQLWWGSNLKGSEMEKLHVHIDTMTF